MSMLLEEIEIPESNDPAWQIQQLRVITSRLDEIKDMEIGDEAYEKILVIEAHVEALREYSGY